ncbi:MAG: aspartate/glutamate racemase family protein, partial [Eubacteriales bacterium]|nr:aspartate/glutamate racemase family protein [Eubacteriales bacterium]
TDFLVKSDVKMIVIACNTVSATCMDDLKTRFPSIPIIGIIEPAAKKVAETCNPGSNVGIIGTKVTIAAHAYKDKISKYNSSLNIHENACPALVPLIEEGITDNEIMDLTIRYYMDSFVGDNNLDSIILGCTHYPLIKKSLAKIYPNLNIINPSSIVVSRIHHVLDDNDMLADGSDFTNVFYASDLSENFLNMIDHIFADEDEDKKVKFLNFDLESEDKK